ncbi:MAG: PEGA domain-containing protein [Candidatus Andersenbacteria bacterium]|nr:PEGA domain-containing protein [Candidatus Andersenbacteria bacterium]
MNRSFRLALLFVSLLLFLVITPFVVLYAIGYRISPQEARAIPVGVLLLETIPRRADVYLENTFIGRTPRAVPNIPPGSAFVSLRKDGYISWEKHVPINATLTSEFRHIRLFPKAPTRQTIRLTICRSHSWLGRIPSWPHILPNARYGSCLRAYQSYSRGNRTNHPGGSNRRGTHWAHCRHHRRI